MERKREHLGLPLEIIYEILANLPVKPLIRFRCVSKSWNALISDSSFQHEHYRRRLKQDPVLLIVSAYSNSGDRDAHPDTLNLCTYEAYDGTYITDFSLPFPVPPSSYSCGSVQICRGLACIALDTDVFVCNPATREIIALPSVGKEPSHCVGFGYTPSTNQFKIFRFFRNPFSCGTKNYCEIFTLGTSQWRAARCPPPNSFSDLSSYAPFLHGAIHFLSDSQNHSANDAIYAFDIESEGYKTIPFPDDYYYTGEAATSPEWSWQCLNELRGSLCMTSNFETSMHLWLLKDYHSGKWVKEYIIIIPELNSEFVWGEPLAIVGDGTILLNINEKLGSGELYWYNPGNRIFEEALMEDFTSTMYVESLLPLVDQQHHDFCRHRHSKLIAARHADITSISGARRYSSIAALKDDGGISIGLASSNADGNISIVPVEALLAHVNRCDVFTVPVVSSKVEDDDDIFSDCSSCNNNFCFLERDQIVSGHF